MRFSAPMYSIYHFSDLIWVSCPVCHELGKVESDLKDLRRPKAQFSCLTCNAHLSNIGAWSGPVQGVVNRACATCGSMINYVSEPTRDTQACAELSCETCETVNSYPITWYRYQRDEPIDRFFGLPLWLQVHVKSNTMWLYNLKHLDYVRSYVSAKLREDDGRHKYSIVTNLPQWIKSRKNRALIIKKLNELEARLEAHLKHLGSEHS